MMLEKKTCEDLKQGYNVFSEAAAKQPVSANWLCSGLGQAASSRGVFRFVPPRVEFPLCPGGPLI